MHHNLALDVRPNTENRSPLRTQPAAGFRLAYAPLPLKLDGNIAVNVTGHGFVLGAKYAPTRLGVSQLEAPPLASVATLPAGSGVEWVCSTMWEAGALLILPTVHTVGFFKLVVLPLTAPWSQMMWKDRCWSNGTTNVASSVGGWGGAGFWRRHAQTTWRIATPGWVFWEARFRPLASMESPPLTTRQCVQIAPRHQRIRPLRLKLGEPRAPALTQTNLLRPLSARVWAVCASVERRAAASAAGVTPANRQAG